MIRESPIGKVRGDNEGDDRFYVAIVLEVRHTGESVTRPALRPPPLQQEHARKLIKGAIAGRLEDPDQGITEQSLAPGTNMCSSTLGATDLQYEQQQQ